MNKPEIENRFYDLFSAALLAHGVSDPLALAYQDQKQGRNRSGVYYHIKDPIAYGGAAREYQKNEATGESVTVTKQTHISKVSVSSLRSSDGLMASSDVAAIASAIVSSLPFIEAMYKSGLQLQKPTGIITTDIINESENYEQESSFSFDLIHTREIRTVTPVVTDFETRIFSV